MTPHSRSNCEKELASVVINEQNTAGTDKKRRYRRSGDIAQLKCTQKLAILPGPTVKRLHRRTVVIAEVVIGEFYCKFSINNNTVLFFCFEYLC